MTKVEREVDIKQLKKIYQIFKAYQQVNALPKQNLSEEEKRLRELERNNPYFSRYVYSGVTNEVIEPEISAEQLRKEYWPFLEPQPLLSKLLIRTTSKKEAD